MSFATKTRACAQYTRCVNFMRRLFRRPPKAYSIEHFRPSMEDIRATMSFRPNHFGTLLRNPNVIRVVVCHFLCLPLSLQYMSNFHHPLNSMTNTIRLNELTTIPRLIRQSTFTFRHNNDRFFQRGNMTTTCSHRSNDLQRTTRLGNTFLHSLCLVSKIKRIIFTSRNFMNNVRRGRHIINRHVIRPFLRLKLNRNNTHKIIKMTRMSSISTLIQGLQSRIILNNAERMNSITPLTISFRCSNASTRRITICVSQVGEINRSRTIIITRGITSISHITLYSIIRRSFHEARVSTSQGMVILRSNFCRRIMSLLKAVSARYPYIDRLLRYLIRHFSTSQ